MADRLQIRSPEPRHDHHESHPTGRILAAAFDRTRNAILRVEDRTGLVFHPLDGSPSTAWPLFTRTPVAQLAVHPDGSVWVATTKGLYRVVGPDPDTVQRMADTTLCVAIDSAGHIAAGTGQGAIWLGKNPSGIQAYAAHKSRVEAVDRRGPVIFSGGTDARVVWADLDADKAVAFSGHVSEVTAVCLDATASRAFSGSKDGSVKAWTGIDGQMAWSTRLPGGGPVHHLVVWNDRLLATGRDRSIWSLTLDKGQLSGPWVGHSRPVGGIFPVGPQTFWTWGRDRSLRRFALPAPSGTPPFFGHSNGVRAVLIEEDHMWTASRDGSLRQWQVPQGIPAGPALQLADIAAVQVLERHGADTLFFGSTDGTVGIVDTKGRVLHRQKLHEGPVTSLLRLHDSMLVSGGADGMLRSWDARRLNPLAARSDHTNRVRCLAAVDDQVVTGSYDGTLALVDPLGGPVQARFEGHTKPVVGVAWTGAHLVSGSLDGTVRCWRPDGTLLHTVEADADGIVGVCHTHGAYVLAVGKSGHATLWRTPDLQQEGHIKLPLPLDGLGCATTTTGTVWVGIGDQRGGITVLEVLPSASTNE
ncbi:MAG: hypothetical protein CL927_02145 [Deltaproteobacteria bacterium]|nr:hypothetical protein [Deltaproteobacteria bacterium]HCH65425.1 hypothetical protein [Deltaproteobacteria bacterium]